MRTAGFLLSLVVVAPWAMGSTTRLVPSEYGSIQAAIMASSDGDTILVAPGTYVENVDFLGRSIHVLGTGGPGTTTLNGGGASMPTVRFVAGETASARLEGFTVTSGSGLNGHGGGILVRDGSSPTIRDCVIRGSLATFGGGIAVENGSSPVVENCEIDGNTAFSFSDPSGGGGVFVSMNSSPTFAGCLIRNNTAAVGFPFYGGGGAQIRSGSQPLFVNCTFTRNQSASGSVLMAAEDAHPTLTNCIVWGNPVFTPDPEIRLQAPSGLTIDHSDVQGGQTSIVVEPGATLTWGAGMLTVDPRFVEDSLPGLAEDYRLMEDSPCVDAGTNSAPGLPATDLDGNPRIVGVIDMGPYELGGATNSPPTAECTVAQLTNIGNQAMVTLDGSASFDEEDGMSLTYLWEIQDAVTLLPVGATSSDAVFNTSLAYGDYVVTLTVTDSAGDSDTCTTDLSVDPATLALFECEKVDVKFCLGDADSDSDDDSSADDHSSGCTSDRVKIKGEIGLPMGVNHTELEAMALVMLDVAGTDFLGAGAVPIEFEVHGGDDKHWKYRDDAGTLGITKLDIDWKGARFTYKESSVPIGFQSELITSSETALTMEYKMSEIGGAFTVSIDGVLLEVDAAGVVTSNDVPAESLRVKKSGKKVTVTLPFPLIESSAITFGGALSGTVQVADHYSNSLGRFKLEAESGTTFPNGADTLPRTVSLMIGVGGPLYPGWCDEGPDDLRVHSRKWRAKH